MYKFILAMHGNSGSEINSIATFQDNESCHLLMKKTNKKIKQGFSWLFYSALIEIDSNVNALLVQL